MKELAKMGNDDRSFSVDGKNSYGLNLFHDESSFLKWGSCTSSPWNKEMVDSWDHFNKNLFPHLGAKESSRLIKEKLVQLICPDFKGSVALTSSGTDVEYVPLMMLSSETLVIIPGSSELGSQTKFACAGSTYGKTFPFQGEVHQGNIEIDAFDVRDENGNVHSHLFEILKEKIEQGLEGRKHIMLHCVSSSKSGAGFPSVSEALELKSLNPEKIHLVMDACQARFSLEDFANWISKDFCVLISGSKFFEGPSFSGAVFIPAGWESTDRNYIKASEHFISKNDLPESLKELGGSDEVNLGLLGRWWVTLENIEKIGHQIFDKERRSSYSKMAQAYLGEHFEVKIENDPTIISFKSKGRETFEYADAWHRLMSNEVFFGRPVKLGSDYYLRLAIGASDLALNPEQFEFKLKKTIEVLQRFKIAQ